jgi:predicted small secreted protein
LNGTCSGERKLANCSDQSVQFKETTMLRKAILTLAVSSIVLVAAACNTVKGVGRDVESVGQAGDKAINH